MAGVAPSRSRTTCWPSFIHSQTSTTQNEVHRTSLYCSPLLLSKELLHLYPTWYPCFFIAVTINTAFNSILLIPSYCSARKFTKCIQSSAHKNLMKIGSPFPILSEGNAISMRLLFGCSPGCEFRTMTCLTAPVCSILPTSAITILFRGRTSEEFSSSKSCRDSNHLSRRLVPLFSEAEAAFPPVAMYLISNEEITSRMPCTTDSESVTCLWMMASVLLSLEPSCLFACCISTPGWAWDCRTVLVNPSVAAIWDSMGISFWWGSSSWQRRTANSCSV